MITLEAPISPKKFTQVSNIFMFNKCEHFEGLVYAAFSRTKTLSRMLAFQGVSCLATLIFSLVERIETVTWSDFPTPEGSRELQVHITHRLSDQNKSERKKKNHRNKPTHTQRKNKSAYQNHEKRKMRSGIYMHYNTSQKRLEVYHQQHIKIKNESHQLQLPLIACAC